MKRVDAFGNAQIGTSGAFRGRLIQMDATKFAIFPESGDPGILEFQDVPVIRGRNLTATFVDGAPFIFQRASCGCSTPNDLRGPARRFLDRFTPADA